MKLEWLAHSCFNVTLESGKVIVFDPFDDSIGYQRLDSPADYVFTSHDHKDHSCLEHLKGDFQVINGTGDFDFGEIKATGYETAHGGDKGGNVTYKVTAEGISILHLGDLGDIPDEEYFKKVGHVDILLVPVGGHDTLDAEKAFAVCKKFEPNIIIPMHYKTIFLELNLDPVYNFTDLTKEYYDRARLGASSFSITAGNMKKRSRIIVMETALEENM